MLVAAALTSARDAGSAEPPRLVLVIAVDQLRSDRLDPTLPGGLGRIAREGRVFADAALGHANTETCPGHAAIATGRHPGAAGVPLNDFFDRESGRSVYCVGDESSDARVLGPSGDAGEGRSPRRLRVPTLGDWLKETSPASRVFSVSGKDRAAIVLGGRRADGVYWAESRPPGGFTTSRYYRESIPEWAERWQGPEPARDAFLSGIPPRWDHPANAPGNGARPDDTPWEVSRFGRESGHPLRSDDRKKFLDQVGFSPWLDSITLDFARELAEREKVGEGTAPDLLAIGLSATDTLGHLYGPGSQEARDALRRLDADMGAFLDALEARVGKGRVLVALTADHGVVELPEYLAQVGTSDCPVRGGRIDGKALKEGLEAALREALDPPGAAASHEPWMRQASLEFTVNRTRAADRGVPVARVVEVAAGFLSRQPGIARVWTADEISRSEGPEPIATLYRNSFDAERSGDLMLQTVPTCVLSSYPSGTSHGTPHLYDRAVPVVFLGPGVEAGIVRGRAGPVDVAPTLARALGIAVPAGLDGRPLPLAGE